MYAQRQKDRQIDRQTDVGRASNGILKSWKRRTDMYIYIHTYTYTDVGQAQDGVPERLGKESYICMYTYTHIHTQVWDKRFMEYLKDLEKKKPVVWCGDLNVAHLDEDIYNVEAKHIPKSASCTPQVCGLGIACLL
jgi:hypothetical protein